jgi:hypothetical protein
MSLIHGKEQEYYLLMAHQIIKCSMTCNSERVYYFSILIGKRKEKKSPYARIKRHDELQTA